MRLVIAAVVLCTIGRLWLMVRLPLADTTEARYGEITRLMVEGGTWLMPHVNPTTPFFAKPPLSTWLEAGSATLLGLHEWTLRLPALIATVVALAAMWLSMPEAARDARWRAVAIAATAPLMLVSAGTVMTDAGQLACIACAMWCATRAVFAIDTAAARPWSIGLGAAVGIGLLAKGLATLVLIGLPIAVFALVTRRIGDVWRRTVSVGGVLVALAIAVPWYWAAEAHYPGFLRYFLIGEHFARFVDPGWQGDRYGRAHAMPIGTIWAFWAGAILPWLPLFALSAWSAWRTRRDMRSRDPVALWWWCWCLAPLVFFTFTRNLIWTYALTAIAPFAILAARGVQHPRLEAFGAIVAVAAIAIAVFVVPPLVDLRSARDLVAIAQPLLKPGEPVTVDAVFEFSASYYLHGAVVPLADPQAIADALRAPGRLAIVDAKSLEPLRTRVSFDTIASTERAALIRGR